MNEPGSTIPLGGIEPRPREHSRVAPKHTIIATGPSTSDIIDPLPDGNVIYNFRYHRPNPVHAPGRKLEQS
jgi:hypothetical protein